MTTPVNPNAASRVDYLEKTGPATFDATGTATTVFRVDSGQYWYPRLIRITATQSGPFGLVPKCTVYLGAVTVLDNSTYIDDTAFGTNDVTTIIAGAIVQNGQAITVKWTGGTNGQQATALLSGIVSNVPLSADIYTPEVPGARFIGHQLQSTANVSGGLGVASLASGAHVTLTVDLSAYQSYLFRLQATTSTAPPTGINPVRVVLEWGLGAGFTAFFTEQYIFFANQQTSVFIANGGMLQIHDNCHGSSLTITIWNDGPDTIGNFLFNLIGNTRPLGQKYVKELSTFSSLDTSAFPLYADNMLIDTPLTTLGAGAQVTIFGLMGTGRVIIILKTQTQQFTFGIKYGDMPVTTQSDGVVVAAGATTRLEYNVPYRPIQILVINNGAANGQFQIWVVAQDGTVI